MLVDVHGDEELPYVFIAGAEGIPNWTDRLQNLQADFASAFRRASPDFQTKFGYEVDAPGQADMRICSNQVGSCHLDSSRQALAGTHTRRSKHHLCLSIVCARNGYCLALSACA